MNYVDLKTMQQLCKILICFIFYFIFQETTNHGRQLIRRQHILLDEPPTQGQMQRQLCAPLSSAVGSGSLFAPNTGVNFAFTFGGAPTFGGGAPFGGRAPAGGETLMDLSHTGATPSKSQAVQVICHDTSRTLDRTDNSQLKPTKLRLVDPNDPEISFVTQMQQST